MKHTDLQLAEHFQTKAKELEKENKILKKIIYSDANVDPEREPYYISSIISRIEREEREGQDQRYPAKDKSNTINDYHSGD